MPLNGGWMMFFVNETELFQKFKAKNGQQNISLGIRFLRRLRRHKKIDQKTGTNFRTKVTEK